MSADTGERFARGIAAKDSAALVALFADEIDFKAMTPGRFWEAGTAREIVDDVILGQWFEPDDHIEAVERVETGSVEDRERVAYRFTIINQSGTFTVEQQAYYSTENDRISWLRVMCSGFRPKGSAAEGLSQPSSTTV